MKTFSPRQPVTILGQPSLDLESTRPFTSNTEPNAPCSHGLRPSEHPRHVFKCYMSAHVTEGRVLPSTYLEFCELIEEICELEYRDGWGKDESVEVRDVSFIRNSLELPRNLKVLGCAERKKRRKPGFLDHLDQLWWKVGRLGKGHFEGLRKHRLLKSIVQ